MAPDATGSWEGGEAYERYMGRWSRAAARTFVDWLGRRSDQRWIDVGCGTGALTQAILDLGSPASVVGVEPSETFLGYTRERVKDARARFIQGTADALPLPDDSADVVASAFVLNFMADPHAALREFLRVTRPMGTVAALVWDYSEGMQFIRSFWDAAVDLDPAASSLDEGVRFPLCRPEPLARLFADAGMKGVRVDELVISTRFMNLPDFWEPFLGGTGPAPGYVASLPESQRDALRALLGERLPREADGAIQLTARGWAVAGERGDA